MSTRRAIRFTADKLVADIMRGVPAPEKVLDSRVAANA